MVSSIII